MAFIPRVSGIRDARCVVPKRVDGFPLPFFVCHVRLPFALFPSPLRGGRPKNRFNEDNTMSRIFAHVVPVAALVVMSTSVFSADGTPKRVTPKDEATAITQLRKSHGGVVVDENDADKPAIGVFLIGDRFSDADMAHLGAFKKLKWLVLHGTRVSDAGLQHLDGLTELRDLSLEGAQVSDVGISHLKGLKALRYLYLQGTGITDAGLIHLKGLTKLEVLDLGNTSVTDSGLASLGTMTGLQILSIRNTKVGDAALERLKRLTQLKSLDLFGTKVTDAGVADLKKALPSCEVAVPRPDGRNRTDRTRGRQ
jgi:hypothetical protein